MESRIQEAIQYLDDFPDAKVATVAREFGIPRNRLRYRLEGRPPKKGQTNTNTKLSAAEEKALCLYIDRLDNINLAVRAEFVTDAANHILQERGKDSPVGQNWTTRFLKRHGYHRRLQKKLNADRQASEDVDRVAQYFQKLQQVIEQHGIPPDDIWNMDETGFRIGVGKDQLIVTKRKRAHYFGLPENRESATAIECIAANGQYLPAFLILTGQLHMSQWYQQPELHEDTVITVSSSGYSNDQISLEWLKHFDQHTAKKAKSKNRLLILDGHGSHHTIEFIEYCNSHHILPFGLPPHLTHLLQPLDVVVFQPLKHYHAKALDVFVRDGLVNISKLEFLSCIQEVRKQAFKETTILSAFRKTGIWPLNPSKVLQILEARQPKETTPPPSSQAGPSSPPFSTPLTLRQVNAAAGKIRAKIRKNDKLSPKSTKEIDQFVKGALVNVTDLVQTKRDLGRTQYAAQIQRQRKAMKNAPLKSGGVLTVAQGRHMVQKKEENELERARRIVEAAEEKRRRAAKKTFEEAAKKARKWRLDGKLKPADIFDSDLGWRVLRRF